MSRVRKLLSRLATAISPVPTEDRDGIQLSGLVWEVAGPKDLGSVFLALPDLLPAGTILYIEGTVQTEDVTAFLADRQAERTTKVALGSLSRRVRFWQMPATRENLSGLAELAAHHAEPEVADTVCAYKDDQALLRWHDLPDWHIWLSKDIPEDRVRTFSEALGLTYRESDIPC